MPQPERRLLAVLATVTMVGATGLAAGGSAGALLAVELTGSRAAAGVPLALLVLGSAVASVVVSTLSSRIGRGRSLAFGYALGVLGALIVVGAASASSPAALYVGSTVLGAANASIFLTRYAAADVGGAGARGRALGLIFFGTALGAVLSSSLLGPSGDLAQAAGLPPAAGLYAVAVATFAVAAVALFLLSLPRGPRCGHRAVLIERAGRPGLSVRSLAAGLMAARARAALVVLATSNLMMVAVMAVAPVHLHAGGMALGSIGLVVSLHVAGMFAPAPVSGWLADRFGAAAVAAAGVALLALSGLAGALVDSRGAALIASVLVVLGVGWNFGVVGASALLAESVPTASRPHAEGIGEAAMGVAAAIGAPLAGLTVAHGSFVAVWLSGFVIAVCAWCSLGWVTSRRRWGDRLGARG